MTRSVEQMLSGVRGKTIISATLILLAAAVSLLGGRAAPPTAAMNVAGTCAPISFSRTTCSFTTTTAVAPGGALTAALLPPTGVMLTQANAPAGCVVSATTASAMTDSCSTGLPAGSTISEQFVLPSQGVTSIVESVLYNANGPQSAPASSLGPCAPRSNNELQFEEQTTCTNSTTVATVSPNSLVMTIGCGSPPAFCMSGSGLQASAPSMAGFCPLAGISGQGSAGPLVVTYTCSGSESVPSETSLVVGLLDVGSDTGAGLNNVMVASSGGAAVPAPSTDQVTFSIPVPSVTPTPAPSPTPSPTPVPGGRTVTFPAGFNLIGGPVGTLVTGATGPLYTFQASDAAYEVLPAAVPLQAGLGYWAFFPSPTTVSLPPAPPPVAFTVALPAGHFVMVGNPSDVPVSLSGADAAYTYGQASAYIAATLLCPGAGAWAYSAGGGSLTLSAFNGPSSCS